METPVSHPRALEAEADEAYRALRALISDNTADRAAVHAARDRFAHVADQLACHSPAPQNRLWQVYANHARRDLREAGHAA